MQILTQEKIGIWCLVVPAMRCQLENSKLKFYHFWCHFIYQGGKWHMQMHCNQDTYLYTAHCDKIRFFIQKIWRLALSCHIGTSIVYTFQISQWCTCTLRYHSTLSTINMSKVASLVCWFRSRAGIGIESETWNILTEIHAVGSNPRSGRIFYFYFFQWCRPRRV